MRVYFVPGGKKVEMEKVQNVKQLLQKLSLRRGEVLVIDRERKELLTIDSPIKEEAEIEIRRVISGG